MLKGSSDYLLTKSKGLYLIALIKFLEHRDNAECNNLTAEIGLLLFSKPLLNRAPRKMEHKDEDGFAVINGETLHSFQLKIESYVQK